MSRRIAYLLTLNSNSERCIFSKQILESIGFNVCVCTAIPDSNQILSHKKSMYEIFKLIMNGNSEWAYIFEDDVNKLENITLDEIIEYEKISNGFFYLGICKYGNKPVGQTQYSINGHQVYAVSGGVRGAHAVAFSKSGLNNFINFSINFTIEYLDIIYELYTLINPTIVVRIDLQSNIEGHLGVIFQDRDKFKSSIK